METSGKSWIPVRTLIVAVLLALLTLGLYWPATHHEFVTYDDVDFVTKNEHVQAGFTWEGLKWACHSEVARNWHPVTMWSHMLDCQFFHLDAGRHHLVNLLFHTANTVVLFLLLNGLTRGFWRSALVAALFAWHPLHVESVAWIAERKDVLSMLFFLLTLWAYANYARKQQQRGSPGTAKGWYGLALLLFALGLMSKPMLVTLPFVLLLLDFWPLQRFEIAAQRKSPPGRKPAQPKSPAAKPSGGARSAWRLVLEKAPFFALSAADCLVTWLLQKQGGSVWAQLPLELRLGNALVSYVRYLGKMFWPESLTAFYPLGQPWPPPCVIGALLLLGLVTSAAVWNLRQRPWFVVGWSWYLGTLVPVIGLVQVGMQSMADRYTYLPLVGIFIALAWAGAELAALGRAQKLLASSAGVVALLGCIAATHEQLGFWLNSETLYRRMLAVTRDNFTAEYDLGDICYAQGKLDEAGQHYAEAVRLSPAWPNAQNNLGDVRMRQKRYDEAILHFTEAVRLKPILLHRLNLANALAAAGKFEDAVPQFEETLKLAPASAEAHRNFGLVLGSLKRIDAAIEQYQAALRLKPDLDNAEFELGNLLANNGKVAEGLPHYEVAVRLKPDSAEAYNSLGFCYSVQRKWEPAEANFIRALSLRPDLWLARKNLGLVYAAENKWTNAVPHLEKALELRPGDALVQVRLGQCLTQTGKPVEAKKHFREALRLDPANAEAKTGLESLRAAK